MTKRRPLIAGNWKMNGTTESAKELTSGLAALYGKEEKPACEMLVCPPFVLIGKALDAAGNSGISVGGQDCHADGSGAHTGDTAAVMLKDVGCDYVIVGHSERRTDHGESDAVVNAKAVAGIEAGLKVIICIGETEAERDAGETINVCTRQIKGSLPKICTAENTVIAYEPVWAIGTGRTPTTDDVADVHAKIRKVVAEGFGAEVAGKMRILYGGSVKPSNAAEFLGLEDVDGALVGGASLKVDDFWAIAKTCL